MLATQPRPWRIVEDGAPIREIDDWSKDDNDQQNKWEHQQCAAKIDEWFEEVLIHASNSVEFSV